MADQIYTPNGAGSGGGDAYYKAYERALNYRFRLTIEPNTEIGASNISGLGTATGEAKYREGNEAEFEHKFPGLRSCDDITIERAIFKTDQGTTATYFTDWQNSQYSVTNRSQASPSTFRRNMTIELLGTGVDNVIAAWYARDCWVKDIKPGSLDASGNDVVKETITISCELCDRLTTLV